MGLLSRTTLAIVLRAPGNVERELNVIRDGLFRTTLAVSTQALPPVFPVAYVDREVARESTDLIPQTRIPPIPLDGLRVCGAGVVVSATLTAPWEEFLEGIDLTEASAGFPPTGCGFFLGSTDLAAAWPTIRDGPELGRTLPGRLSVLNVELMSIRVGRDPWWSEIDWEVCWSRRLKLRGVRS